MAISLPKLDSQTLLVEMTEGEEAREYIISELFETEKNYLDKLNKMKQMYESALVSIDKEFKRVFQHLDEIILVNNTLFAEIRTYTIGKSTKNLGEIFINFEPLFKFYKHYCVEYKRAQEIFLLKKNDKKTKDLLLELLTNTPSTSPDYEHLTRARKSTQNIADFINSSMREAENREKFIDLNRTLHYRLTEEDKKIPNFMASSRKLMYEGQVWLIPDGGLDSFDDTSTWKNRHLYLFNDLILICIIQIDQRLFDGCIFLNIAPVAYVRDLEFEECFQVIGSTTLTIQSPEKVKWMQEVESVIQNCLNNDTYKLEGKPRAIPTYSPRPDLSPRHSPGLKIEVSDHQRKSMDSPLTATTSLLSPRRFQQQSPRIPINLKSKDSRNSPVDQPIENKLCESTNQNQPVKMSEEDKRRLLEEKRKKRMTLLDDDEPVITSSKPRNTETKSDKDDESLFKPRKKLVLDDDDDDIKPIFRRRNTDKKSAETKTSDDDDFPITRKRPEKKDDEEEKKKKEEEERKEAEEEKKREEERKKRKALREAEEKRLEEEEKKKEEEEEKKRAEERRLRKEKREKEEEEEERKHEEEESRSKIEKEKAAAREAEMENERLRLEKERKKAEEEKKMLEEKKKLTQLEIQKETEKAERELEKIRLESEKKVLEESRRLEEEARLVEEKKKKIEAEKRKIQAEEEETRRLEEEREKRRLKRLEEEEKRREEERKEKEAEERREEERRIRREKRLEEERAEAQRHAEEERAHAEEKKRHHEEKMAADRKKMEEKRLQEAKEEEEALADRKRKLEEKLKQQQEEEEEEERQRQAEREKRLKERQEREAQRKQQEEEDARQREADRQRKARERQEEEDRLNKEAKIRQEAALKKKQEEEEEKRRADAEKREKILEERKREEARRIEEIRHEKEKLAKQKEMEELKVQEASQLKKEETKKRRMEESKKRTEQRTKLGTPSKKESDQSNQHAEKGKKALFDKDLSTAIEELSNAIDLDQFNINAYFNRAFAYYSKKQLEKTIADLNHVIDMDPDHVKALSLRATCLRSLNRIEEAIEDLIDSLAIDGKLIQNIMSLGICYDKLDQGKNAISQYSKYLALDDSSKNAVTILYNRAQNYYLFGDYQNAVNDYNKAIKLTEDDLLKTEMQSLKAKCLVKLDKIEDVGKVEIKTTETHDVDVLKSQAQVLYSTKKFSEAIEAFSRIISMGEKDHIDYFNRGLCYKNLGDDAKALRDFKSCLSMKSDFAAAHKMMAKIYANNQDLDNAIDSFTSAIEIAPTSDLYFDRGVLHDAQKNGKLAVKDFTQAYKLDPKNIDALYNRASIYQRQLKNYEAAIDDYNLILDEQPDDLDALLDRAVCFYQIEDDVSSKRDFRKLFKMDANHDRAKKLYKKCGFDQE